jgi:hypothetical protein
VAFRLAQVDPNAKIRAWAASLVSPGAEAQGTCRGESNLEREHSTSDGVQAPLF